MLAERLHGEEVIEGGDTVCLTEGNAEGFRDEAKRGLVQVAEGFLNGMKSLYQGVARETVTPHRAIDDAPALIVRGKRRFFYREGHVLSANPQKCTKQGCQSSI